MSFNESNTVEQMILDALESLGRTTAAEPMQDAPGLPAPKARFNPSPGQRPGNGHHKNHKP
ncbi:MAG: hypothetical protein ACYDH9_24755 [Limisphaerales bacterium]